MIKYLFGISLVLMAFPADAQWEAVNPSGTYGDLIQAIVPRGTLLQYAVGSELIRSDDQGDNWSVRPDYTFPTEATGRVTNQDIVFSSENTGYSVFQNKIFKTSNGGDNWHLLLELAPNNTRYQSSASFNALDFVDDLNGYAVGSFKKIFKTTDGGEHWEPLSWSPNTTPYISYTDVYFRDAQHGYIAGNEKAFIEMNFGYTAFIQYTNDGGLHWERHDLPTTFDYNQIYFQFVNENDGFVVGHGSTLGTDDVLFATHDGGTSWTICTPDMHEIQGICWTTDHTGFAVGSDLQGKGVLYRTDDAGAHWIPVDIPLGDVYPSDILNDIRFSDTQHGFVTGQGGYLASTKDGGTTWTQINASHPGLFTFAMNGETQAYGSPATGLYHSDDGGISWKFADDSDTLRIFNIKVTNPGEGYFYGFRSFLYHFAEDATRIERLTLPVNFVFDHKLIATADSIYVAGRTIENSINLTSFLKSGDGGKTWENYNVTTDANSVMALQEYDGVFCVATTSEVLTSTNGGKSWTLMTRFANDYISSLILLNRTTIVAVMVSLKVKYSTDGGRTWTDAAGNLPPENTLLIGTFKENNSTLYIYGGKQTDTGTYAALWRSTDRGRSWREQALPKRIGQPITAMSMNEQYVYAMGNHGQLFRQLKTTADDPSPEDPDPVGIESLAGRNSLLIFPVPAVDELMVVTSGHENLLLCIYNLHGQKQSLSVDITAASCYRVHVIDLAPGVYILEVRQEQGCQYARFIKK